MCQVHIGLVDISDKTDLAMALQCPLSNSIDVHEPSNHCPVRTVKGALLTCRWLVCL